MLHTSHKSTMNIVLKTISFYYQPVNCFLNTLRHSSQAAQRVCSPVGRLIDRLQRNDIQNIKFSFDNCNRVVVYTDGCCFNNNNKDITQRRSGLGVYWGEKDHPLNISAPVFGTLQTSNRAELLAAHAAILIAVQMEIPELCLRLDSTYVKNGCEKWLHRWSANNWLTSKGTFVKNQDLWIPLSIDLEKIKIKLEKVNDGSSNGQKNAHNLANFGASLVKSEV